jgi:hypothetical protein
VKTNKSTATVSRLMLVLVLCAVSGVSQNSNSPKSATGFKLPPNFASKVAEYTKALVRVTQFSGAILVASDGRPFYCWSSAASLRSPIQ